MSKNPKSNSASFELNNIELFTIGAYTTKTLRRPFYLSPQLAVMD